MKKYTVLLFSLFLFYLSGETQLKGSWSLQETVFIDNQGEYSFEKYSQYIGLLEELLKKQIGFDIEEYGEEKELVLYEDGTGAFYHRVLINGKSAEYDLVSRNWSYRKDPKVFWEFTWFIAGDHIIIQRKEYEEEYRFLLNHNRLELFPNIYNNEIAGVYEKNKRKDEL